MGEVASLNGDPSALYPTSAPMWRMRSSMVRMSRTWGTRSRITGSPVSETGRHPRQRGVLRSAGGDGASTKGVPPWIWKRSNLCVFLGLECYGQFTASLGR